MQDKCSRTLYYNQTKPFKSPKIVPLVPKLRARHRLPPLRRSNPLIPVHKGIDHLHHITADAHFRFRQPLSVIDAKDLHPFMVVEICKQFGRDEEVLPAVGLAGYGDKGIMHSAFVSRVHSLGEQR